MKKLLLVLALLCAFAGISSAQISISVPNDTVTGTTLNKLAKYNTTAAATSVIITATIDTTGAIGIVTADTTPGTSGIAVLTISGVAPCVFDNATTPNDFVQISSGTAGDCHDTGSAVTRPTSGQIIGTVFGAGGAAGTYNVSLNKDIYPAGVVGSTILNEQGPATAVTGTGAAANLYTFSMPGNSMSTVSCVRATAFFQHTTGTASTTFTWNFGAASFTSSGSTVIAGAKSTITVCNSGATNSQWLAVDNLIVGTTLQQGAQFNTSAIDTTASTTISFQFTVAGTDAVTPKGWLVESIH